MTKRIICHPRPRHEGVCVAHVRVVHPTPYIFCNFEKSWYHSRAHLQRIHGKKYHPPRNALAQGKRKRMTTLVTVRPSGHACLITINDAYCSPAGVHSHRTTEEVMLAPWADGKPTGYPQAKEFMVTTSQSIFIGDLEHDDNRVLEAKGIPMAEWPMHKKDYKAAPLFPPRGETREDPSANTEESKIKDFQA